MKEGWTLTTLGELFDIGSSKRVHKSDWSTHGVPFYRAREIVKLAQYGYVNNELYITNELYSEYKKRAGVPAEGDLMVTAVGTLGVCYAVKAGDIFYFKDASVLWFRQRGIANPRYVEYAFQSPQVTEQVADTVGATVGTLTISRANSIQVPMTSLAGQQRIVAILDEAFDYITRAKANAEQTLKNVRKLFESHLQAVFTQRGEGWVETTIGTVCTLKSGTSVGQQFEKAAGDIPYVKVADMSYAGNESEIVSSSRFLNMEDIGRNSVFPAGTTIFPKRGGAILTNKKRFTAVPICTDLNIMGVIPPKSILPKLLFYYFLNVDMRQLGSGSSIPQINNYDIAPLAISYPKSIEQQSQLLGILEELSIETQRLESICQQKLAALDELKKSLLHKAFSGEL